MRLPNPEIRTEDVLAVLRDAYGIEAEDASFVPKGLDSWCYRVGDCWLSVRRDRQGHVPEAYAASRELHDGGLAFVVPPRRGRHGAVVHRSPFGAPVVTFDFLAGAPIVDGPTLSRTEAAELRDLVATLHCSTTSQRIPHEAFRPGFLDELRRVLPMAAARDPGSGPYSARLHKLLAGAENALAATIAAIERQGDVCRALGGDEVLTHGEPGAANVMRVNGGLVIVDWGAMSWAPPERDWFHLRRSFGFDYQFRAEMERFYGLRWVLGEITEYTAELFADHDGDEEDAAMWAELEEYVDDVVSDATS